MSARILALAAIALAGCRAQTRDERTLQEDRRQADGVPLPSPAGHLWRISGDPPSRPPDYANVPYGPHERNILDLWKAESKEPTPVLVCFHGGGFRAGEKTTRFALRPYCLKEGISVATVNYRFSQHALAPASLRDGARAVQFLRAKAREWNLDPKRIAACGNSAGAGISLWIGLRDDLADPTSADPVERESTRISCTITYSGQTSYDTRFIHRIIQGPAYKHPAVLDFFGMKEEEALAPPPEKAKLMEEASAINFVTADDPPAYLVYGPLENRPTTPETNQSDGIHHPMFGNALKAKMDALGIECHVRCKGDDLSKYPPEIEFLKKAFGM